jgi:hypothetical protein
MPHGSRFAGAGAPGRVRPMCKFQTRHQRPLAHPELLQAGHTLSLAAPRQVTRIDPSFLLLRSQARSRAGRVCDACQQRRVRGAGGTIHYRPPWFEQHGVQLLGASPGGAGCGVRRSCHVSMCSTDKCSHAAPGLELLRIPSASTITSVLLQIHFIRATCSRLQHRLGRTRGRNVRGGRRVACR